MNMTLTSALLSFSLGTGLLLAQTPGLTAPQALPPLSGVVRLNRLPVANEVLSVKLPRVVERRLTNGLKLLVVESHRVPGINLTINLPSGSLRDSADLPGLSDATAALIRLGTKTRSSKDLADKLAEIGASLTIASGNDQGFIFLSANTENFDEALGVLADVLLNPTFPQDEFEKWKTRQKAQLQQMMAQPGFLGADRLYRTLYPDDGRHVIRPTSASLDKMTRDDVLAHYRKFYIPSGQLSGIAGDITPAEAVAKLEKALSAWKGGPVARIDMPLPGPIAEKKIYFTPRPNSVQTFLTIANLAIDRGSPDYIACQVLNHVLGGGPTSRLFRNIREEKGYTYGIGSNFSTTRVLNFFGASTSVRTEVTEPALTEILKEFNDIRTRDVPAGELEDAKNAIVASFVLGLERSNSVLSRWIDQRVHDLPADYWDTYAQKVMAVTAADVRKMAQKYVPLDNAQIIAVGDPKIAELLKKFGPVEIVTPPAN